MKRVKHDIFKDGKGEGEKSTHSISIRHLDHATYIRHQREVKFYNALKVEGHNF